MSLLFLRVFLLEIAREELPVVLDDRLSAFLAGEALGLGVGQESPFDHLFQHINAAMLDDEERQGLLGRPLGVVRRVGGILDEVEVRRHDLRAFLGRRVEGEPATTQVGGQVVIRSGDVGHFLFQETFQLIRFLEVEDGLPVGDGRELLVFLLVAVDQLLRQDGLRLLGHLADERVVRMAFREDESQPLGRGQGQQGCFPDIGQFLVRVHDHLVQLLLGTIVLPPKRLRVFGQLHVRVGEEVRVVVEPEKQRLVVFLIAVASLLLEESLHPRIVGRRGPLIAKHVIDQQRGRLVRGIVRADERAFFQPMIELGEMPKEETDILVVHLVVVVVIVSRIERQVFAKQLLMFRDERPPDAESGDDVFEISGHAEADLLGVVGLERVDQLGAYHHLVDAVGQAGIVSVDGRALFIRM